MGTGVTSGVNAPPVPAVEAFDGVTILGTSTKPATALIARPAAITTRRCRSRFLDIRTGISTSAALNDANEVATRHAMPINAIVLMWKAFSTTRITSQCQRYVP